MRFLLPWGVLFGSDFARGQSFYDVSCQWLRDHPERLGLEFQSNSVGLDNSVFGQTDWIYLRYY